AVNFAFWANVVTGLVAGTLVGLLVLRFAPLSAALVVGATIVVLALGSTSLGMLQGTGDTGLVGLIIFGETMVKLAVGILLVVFVHDTATMALFGLFVGSSVLFFSLYRCWQFVGRPTSPRAMKSLLISSAHIGGVQL